MSRQRKARDAHKRKQGAIRFAAKLAEDAAKKVVEQACAEERAYVMDLIRVQAFMVMGAQWILGFLSWALAWPAPARAHGLPLGFSMDGMCNQHLAMGMFCARPRHDGPCIPELEDVVETPAGPAAAPEPLYSDRNIMHKYMGPPGSCEKCDGRGWYPAADEEGYEIGERFCDCPAGAERRRVET